MKLEVKIEIRSIVRKITTPLTDGNTHDFTVFVQGLNGNKIEHFVQHVAFYLPFNSSNSKQVKSKPPYLISGSASASFRLPIDVFLHTSGAGNKVRYSYFVCLPDKPVENCMNVKTLTFGNTPHDFRERLLQGGAGIVNSENTSEKNVEDVEYKTEPTEPSDIQDGIHRELPNTVVQSKDNFVQKGSVVIQEVYSFDELMIENEILKKENEILRTIFNKNKGKLASCKKKFPVLRDNVSAVNTELDELLKKSERNEAKISSLKSSIQTLMPEAIRHDNRADEAGSQFKRRKKSLSSSTDSGSFPGLIPIAEINNLNSKEQNLEHPNAMKISQRDNSSKKEPHKNIFMQSIEEHLRNSSHKEKSPVSNVLKTGLCQNEEKSKNCGQDEVQVCSSNQTDTEVTILSCSKKEPIKKNRVSSKESTIFLPIPRARKRPSDTNQNLDSTKQRCISSVSATTADEQLHLPAKTSSVTISIEDETPSFSVPTSENESALNSVNKNLLSKAGTNRNQSVSIPVSPNLQFKNRTKNENFKRLGVDYISLYPIEHILKEVDDKQMCKSKQNYHIHLLTEYLTNRTNCPKISDLIFLVIDYLLQTTKNYLQAFIKDRANYIFLPSSESCIVSALFEIEKKHKTYSELKLIENTLNTIFYLVMTLSRMKGFNLYGFASLCRVFTEICKRKGDLLNPLTLCVEILKKKLRFAPYFIASVVGIWKEPFMLPSDQSEEAMILLGSISMGARKRTKGMDDIWLCTAKFISECFPFPSLPDINVAIKFLKDKIISNCNQNSHEKSSMLTSSFVILASIQPWEWTKEHMINEFILPNLSRYAVEEPNEKAFALFCELCVDAYNIAGCMKHRILKQYFVFTPKEGCSFVQEWATVSFVKYLILTRQKIGQGLSDWLRNNQDKLIVKEFNDFYARRNMYYQTFKSSSIVIT